MDDLVSWGALLNDPQQFVLQAWWLAVLALNRISNGVQEAGDPRLVRR